MASGVDEAATAATVTGEQLVPILTYNFQFGANTTVGVMAGLVSRRLHSRMRLLVMLTSL